MTTFQKVVKYLAIALAVYLCIMIFSGVLGVIGVIAGLSVGDGVAEDMNAYTVSQEITELEIQISAADFSILTDATFSVQSNLENLTVKENDGCLIISENPAAFWQNDNGAVLDLCIPEDFTFSHVQISTGAGKFSVEELSADTMQLDFGAGEVEIGTLNAGKQTQINGGAGKITIAGGVLNNLTLDMGIGELNLTAAVMGDSDLDYGVGEANLTLLGTKEDYRIELDKGIGNAVVDGQTLGDDAVYGSGINEIDIDGGVGAIRVQFAAN